MKRIIIFGLIVGIIFVGISSCSLMGTSMTDRIGMFEDDLNGSRANIMDNIHPDAPGYNTANIAGYWENPSYVWGSGDAPFSISNISEGSSSVSASFSSNTFPGGTTIYFEMKDDGSFFGGEDWKIWSCTVNSVGQF